MEIINNNGDFQEQIFKQEKRIDESPYTPESYGKINNVEDLTSKIIVPPPMVKKTVQITNNNSYTQTGDIVVGEHGELLRKYLEFSEFTRFLTEGYDTMMLRYQRFITNTRIRFKDNKVIRFNVNILPPSIPDPNDTNKTIPMTPIMARERDLTYAAKVNIKMFLVNEFVDANGNIVEQTIQGEETDFSQGEIPVMIGSSYDNIRAFQLNDAQKLQYGECPHDVQGYFHVKGNEYVILNQDALMEDRMLVYAEGDKIVGNMTIRKWDNNTEMLKVFKDPKTGTYRFTISAFGNTQDGNSLNIFQIFRMFGYYDPHRILSMIRQLSSGSAGNLWSRIKVELSSTLIEYQAISSESDFSHIAEFKNNKDYTSDPEKYRNIYLGELYQKFYPQYLESNRFHELPFKYVDNKGIQLTPYEIPGSGIGGVGAKRMMFRYPNNPHIVIIVDMQQTIKTKEEYKQKRTIIDDMALVGHLKREQRDTYGNVVYIDIQIDSNGNEVQVMRENEVKVYKKYTQNEDIIKKKLYMFSIFINKIIEVNIGERKPHNRDGWENKMIKTPANFMFKILTNSWNRLIRDIKLKATTLSITKNDPRLSDITLSDISFTDKFVSSFTTMWDKEPWKKEDKRITDILSRHSITSAYAYVLRISAPISRKSKKLEIRQIKASQWGFVCFIDTPEGENCGLIMAIAMGCWISIHRDINLILALIDYSVDLSKNESENTSDMLFANGKFIAFCNGRYLKNKLKKFQTDGEIPHDVTILYDEDDRILHIYSIEGRPVRPLLKVDQGKDEVGHDIPQNLVLHDKMKAGIVKNVDDFDQLMKQDCVEYISPWEQDKIMLAESINDLRSRENDLTEYQTQLDKILQMKSLNDDPKYLSIYSKKMPILLSYDDYMREVDGKVKKFKEEINVLNSEISSLNSQIMVKVQSIDEKLSDISREALLSQQLSVSLTELNEYQTSDDPKINELVQYANQQVTFIITDFVIDGKKIIENIEEEIIEKSDKIEEMQKELKKLTFLQDEGERKKPTGTKYFDDQINSIEATIAEIRAKKKYTHCEIDPNAILGISASIIPLPDHNQGPRNAYQCNMGRQALGIYLSNYRHRFDKTGKVLAWPTRPIFETQMNKNISLDKLGSGEMTILAIMSYLNYGEEDAIIINKSSLDRGMFKMIINKTIVGELTSNKYGTGNNTVNIKDEFSSKEELPQNFYKDASIYDHLDERGVAKVGSMLKVGDCVIGIKRTIIEDGVKTLEDKSIYVKIGEDGIVDHIIYTPNNIVKVTVRRVVSQIVGNKFATRYAQKSTISRILHESQMPERADGSVPSIIMNPHAIPSRMTLGQLIEMTVSKAGAMKGERVNATAFNSDFNIEDYKRILKNDFGYNEWGWEVLRNRLTGERFKAQIFVGPVFYQALKHHVQDKAQVRGRGPRTELTRQAVGGRGRSGGLRFGEMERDVLISHGASKLVQEVYMESADKYECVVCSNCNEIAYPDARKRYRCPNCDNKGEFGKLDVPYSYMLINRYLAGAGIRMALKPTESTE